jgi:hypothetical protein
MCKDLDIPEDLRNTYEACEELIHVPDYSGFAVRLHDCIERIARLESENKRLRERVKPSRAGKCLECNAALDSPTKIGYCDTCFRAWLEQVDAARSALAGK